MFRTAFKKAVEKYLNTTFPSEASRAKGVLTRIVSSSTESDTLEQIQEVLAEFGELPESIKNRFTPGSLYKENGAVLGWYCADQRQAESLPVNIYDTPCKKMEVVGTGLGFVEAVRLPLREDKNVCIPCTETFFYAKHGWANACSIQWSRDEEGYKVDRSIIPHGFWKAWKWWDGAQDWYLERRPELFVDFDCWSEPQQGRSAQPKYGDVVLGGKKANKEFWESQKFYLE